MKFNIREIIKHVWTDKKNNNLRDNFLSLSTLQIANYIFPLITLPYLVRVLGPEKYGLISFASAFIIYFLYLTDYGFNFSATKYISINRNNKEKIDGIFSSIILIKLFLLIISFILLSVIVFSFDQFKNDWLVYFLTFGTVIGNVLFPTWFFQGMEKMKYITILNIISKLIFTVLIFIFIREISDFIYVPLINSFGFIFAGILGLVIAITKFDLKLTKPTYDTIKLELKEGWHLFISTASTSLYTNSNTFILGLFTNNVIVSHYAASINVVSALVGLLTAFSQSIYPHINKLANEHKEKAISFILDTIKAMTIFGLLLTLILFIFADIIVNILFGSQFAPAIIDLRILSFLPLLLALSTVFGIQTMTTFNHQKAYSRLIVITGILNVCLALILVPLYQDIGTSTSYLIAEIFLTLSTFLYVYKKGLLHPHH